MSKHEKVFRLVLGMTIAGLSVLTTSPLLNFLAGMAVGACNWMSLE